MTTTTTGGQPPRQHAEQPAADTVTSAAAATGLSRLHPVDGLFLKSEHLDRIQDYAGMLNRLSCLAGGSGTVYGFELTVDEKGEQVRLRAAPGLAVSEEGRLLRGVSTLEVDLGDLERGLRNRFWVVEVVPAPSTLSGLEPAYTSACATSCGPGSSIHPWEDETVTLRVRSDALDGWWGQASDIRRSALASAWFERERMRGAPWLAPGSKGDVVDLLRSRPWSLPPPEGPPVEAAVPLGLLFHGEKEGWVVDTWAARRDRELPPPQSAWLGRMSMRPWSAYLAQVLQFQDQLAELERDELERDAGSYVDLTEHFAELPPGGFLDEQYLDQPQAQREGNDRVRVIHCSADVAVSAVTLAQHLDRIPLTAQEPPAIDLWVPKIQADLPSARAERYGWIAFTRGVQVDEGGSDHQRTKEATSLVDLTGSNAAPERLPDEVKVFVLPAPHNRTRYADAVEGAVGEPLGVVRFLPGGWVLADPDSLEDLRPGLTEGDRVDVVATSTSEAGREPIAVARASALARALRIWEHDDAGVFAVRGTGAEAIYLMVRP